MRIEIKDDLDLEKIKESGQAFRISKDDKGVFRFITGGDVLYISKAGKDACEISCSKDKWDSLWHDYFDLDRNYSGLRDELRGKNRFIDECMEYGKGIRILRQDPFEMLITFIISQRKNIPAISASVEKLCESFGKRISSEGEDVFLFPTPEALARATDDELKACSLGYRAPYVACAARMVSDGELDLEALYTMSDEEVFDRLIKVYGVGKKVANCICLFAYARVGMVPVDVWIGRAIDERFGGESPFESFGEYAGIIQQYVFYTVKNQS